MTARECAWCRGPIPASARVDAITCSKPCRQARSRFALTVGGASPATPLAPMSFAYADPPYPGKSKRYYGEHPDFAGEVDHAALVERLSAYDGWALSTSASALQYVLSLCPSGSRVAAWHRGERTNRHPVIVNAWEPVIYFGARPVVTAGAIDVSRGTTAALDLSHVATLDVSNAPGEHDASRGSVRHVASDVDHDASQDAGATRRVDSIVLGVTARTTDPQRVVGAKPAGFARWMFDLLGVRPGDSFDDLFPGSGAIARAWDVYVGRAA